VRKGLELLLALVLAVVAWLLAEFMVMPPLALAAVVFVGLGDKLGWVATGALAGAVAGAGVGLAPRWSRWGFWVGAAVAAAAGFGAERATGFFQEPLSLGPGWAALALASVAGPMMEFVGWGPPPAISGGLVARAFGWEASPAAVRGLRMVVASILGGLAGAIVADAVIAHDAEYGPIGLRIAFALGHVLLCAALRCTGDPRRIKPGPWVANLRGSRRSSSRPGRAP